MIGYPIGNNHVFIIPMTVLYNQTKTLGQLQQADQLQSHARRPLSLKTDFYVFTLFTEAIHYNLVEITGRSIL